MYPVAVVTAHTPAGVPCACARLKGVCLSLPRAHHGPCFVRLCRPTHAPAVPVLRVRQEEFWKVLMNDSSSLSKLTAIAAAFEDNAARGERCFSEILKLNKSPATLRSFAAVLEVRYIYISACH